MPAIDPVKTPGTPIIDPAYPDIPAEGEVQRQAKEPSGESETAEVPPEEDASEAILSGRPRETGGERPDEEIPR